MFNPHHPFPPFPSKVWLSSPTMHGEELKYMTEAYETNWMSTLGENINQVEQMLCEKTECRYAVALSSGTAALHMAVKLAGEKVYGSRGQRGTGTGTLQGRRVFCSDLTFAATVNPVVYEGGIPVFIDSEYDTWNMDPLALERAFQIYPEVKVVVMAHLYGTPGKIQEIKKICDSHGAVLIEDAAESFGAFSVSGGTGGKTGTETRAETGTGNRTENQTGNGIETGIETGAGTNRTGRKKETGVKAEKKQTGTFGDYNAVSFNGNKIITGSSGGALLTEDGEAAEKVRKWSAQSRENAPWYQHEEIGYNYRMSNVAAGVVRGQLPHLEEHIARKKEIYERYEKGLRGLPVQMNPYDRDKSGPNFWLSCLLIEAEGMCRQVRSEKEMLYRPEHGKSCPMEILEALESIHAEGRPVWKPMHMQPFYRMQGFVNRGEDTGADIFQRGLCLPSDIKMKEGEQERIIEVVRACFE